MRNITIIIIVILLVLIPIEAMCMEDSFQIDEDDSKVNIENEIHNITQEQLNNLDMAAWEEFIEGLDNSETNPFYDINAKEMIMNIIKGKFDFDWQNIFQTIGKMFFSELYLNLSLMIKIIVIAIITGILNNFKTSFTNASVGELAWIVCYIMVVVLIVQSVTLALDLGRDAIEQMTSFMRILFPILLALLISIGGIASSGILQPATVLLSGVTGIFLKNIMIPLIFLTTVLVLVSNINDNIKLERLSKLTKNISTWILGIIFTIFIGVLSIQGILAASFDGISIRTTKYAIEAVVPVVGKMFSQTVDILIGCSFMLKNAVGVVGLIVAIGICLFPTLKIISLVATYKLCAALLEPISDKRIVSCLDEVGSILIILFITVVGVAIMFFMTIALLVGLGNITVMMR